MYYKETWVTGEPYDWQSKSELSGELLPRSCEWTVAFDDERGYTSRMYRDFKCQHHLIQETGRHEERPDIPALTPGGFETWARVLIKAYPSTEYERLQKALEVFRIRDKGGSPITIDRSLFPEQANLKIREDLKKSIEKHILHL